MELFDSLGRKKEDAGAKAQERWQIGGRIENRYEIHDIKGGEGKSGFGIVYICYDHEFKKPVAIKTFQAKFLHNQRARDDFTEEALRWIKLDKHKNIVKADYVKNIEGQPYIFLEYVAGGNLDDWLYTKMLDFPLALNFAVQFCSGMDYAYKKLRLIHRDIKPRNILLTMDKTVKITDFGLAKAIQAKAEQIAVPSDISYVQSSTAGTLPYMAPEQWTAGEIDTRADIYAFGIVLYQMVTSSYPYPMKSSWQEIHLKESPLPIKQNIPKGLNFLIFKCLEKERSKRYQNFSELKEELFKIYFGLTGERIIEETAEELEACELVNKGSSLSNLGRHQEALACSDKALDIDPRNAGAWNNKGIALYNLGRHQEALVCYDKAIEIDPRYHKAWNNKGNPLNNLGRHQEALACYDKAIEINPRYHEAWSNKGYALNNLGRHQEALACYDKALDINPRFAEVLVNKGAALYSLGRFQEALVYFDKAIEINPRLADAWNNKGAALNNLDRHQEALACFDKALDINPRFAETWSNKGYALSKLCRHQEALACYDKAIEINPRYAEAWYYKGLTLQYLGMLQEAVGCYDKALETNPRLAEAWNNKGAALDKLGRHQEAVGCYDKALQINPRLADAWNNKGLALQHLGKLQEAIACYDNALEMNPRFALAWYNKGHALRKLGTYQEAIFSFQKFIEFAPLQYAFHVISVEEIIRQLKRMV